MFTTNAQSILQCRIDREGIFESLTLLTAIVFLLSIGFELVDIRIYVFAFRLSILNYDHGGAI